MAITTKILFYAALLASIVPLGYTIGVYRRLPAMVAMQWDFRGDPTWRAPRSVFLAFMIVGCGMSGSVAILLDRVADRSVVIPSLILSAVILLVTPILTWAVRKNLSP
jgi:uncharacterized membrane protein